MRKQETLDDRDRSSVKISDFIDLSRKEEIEAELSELEYHNASYLIDEDKGIISFFVPLGAYAWEKQRQVLKNENRFTDLIKKYGTEDSKRNK